MGVMTAFLCGMATVLAAVVCLCAMRLGSTMELRQEAQLSPPLTWPADELPLELPPGAVVEGYCVDPGNGLRYPYGSASDGTFWVADMFGWAGWRTREARDEVIAIRRWPDATGVLR